MGVAAVCASVCLCVCVCVFAMHNCNCMRATVCVCAAVCGNFFVAYFGPAHIFHVCIFHFNFISSRYTQPPLALSVCVCQYGCVCIYMHCKICHENQQKCTPSRAHTHSHTLAHKMHVNEPQFAVFSFRFSVCSNRKILTPHATAEKNTLRETERDRERGTRECMCDHCNCISILLLVSLEGNSTKKRGGAGADGQRHSQYFRFIFTTQCVDKTTVQGRRSSRGGAGKRSWQACRLTCSLQFPFPLSTAPPPPHPLGRCQL